MKNIVGIQFTNDPLTATQLSVTVADDTGNGCSFVWSLFTANNIPVDNGAIPCLGDDYTNYKNGDQDFPYGYVANNLSKPLTLL